MAMPRHTPAAYTVAWISALPIEFAAALEILDEEHEDPRDHIRNTDQYAFGQIGQHKIVLACLPSGQMGTNQAAALAARLTTTFPSIEFALMVGIGGGVPSRTADIRLGDVVIGNPHLQHGGVVQYDFGKTGSEKMERIGSLDKPPTVLLNAITTLRSNHYRALNNTTRRNPDHQSIHRAAFSQSSPFHRDMAGSDILFQATYVHKEGQTCDNCDMNMIVERPERDASQAVGIHYGTVASGNQVIKDGVTRDKISAELGGVLCFEMEAAGLASAFRCVVIRGICDYADSHKNKSWQPYAAGSAAAVAKQLLLTVPPMQQLSATVSAKPTRTTEHNATYDEYRIPFNLKGVPLGRFAERPNEMNQLEQSLLPQHTKPSECRRKVLILQGLGGIGKTRLAAEFARRHQEDFTSVFWIDGSSEQSLRQSIAHCVSRIRDKPSADSDNSGELVSDTSLELDATVRTFMEWLSQAENKSWLVVFDNVDRDYQHQEVDPTAYDIEKYIPEAENGSILITTRLANLQYLGYYLPLGSVGIDEARIIFRKWYNQDFDFRDSDELFELLNGLPLALAQAAAYMSGTGTNFSDYIRLYKKEWKALMEAENPALRKAYNDRSINTTWTMSYNAIRAKNSAAANYLLLWSHLDNTTLPFGIFEAALDEAKHPWNNSMKPLSDTLSTELGKWLGDAAWNEVSFLEMIRLLQHYGLVENLQGTSGYKAHPVVHQWAYHMQDKQQVAELSQLAILVVGLAYSYYQEHGEYSLQRQIWPHGDSWVERNGHTIDGTEVKRLDILNALQFVGCFLIDRDSLFNAEKALQIALAGQEKVSGIDRDLTLLVVNDLAHVYAEQREMQKAEELCLRAIKGYETQEGPESLETLFIVANLGYIYREQGKLKESEDASMRALRGYERAWGKDYIWKEPTLVTFNNLSILYRLQGRLKEAEKMSNDAIEGCKILVGPDDFHTFVLAIHATFNLAMILEDQKRSQQAHSMCIRALEGYERVFGVDSHYYLETEVCIRRLEDSHNVGSHQGSSSLPRPSFEKKGIRQRWSEWRSRRQERRQKEISDKVEKQV